jgi:DNA ligase (NAD+)
MGRTGVLTPVAIFEPVEIEGAIIERASLHNLSVIKQTLGVPYTNQPIRIFRANMIIPQVYDGEPGEGLMEQVPIVHPLHCPICGAQTEVRDSETTSLLACSNPRCEGKFINKLDHFCGKSGLDIKGLSTATLQKVIDWGWVGNIKELFSLCLFRDEWIGKPGFGPKSVDNILNAIEQAKQGVELDAYITALGIQFVGPATAKVLADYFGSWEAFMEADDDCFDYTEIPSIGPETAGALTGFDFSEAYYIAKNLVKVNDIPKEEKKDNSFVVEAECEEK